MAPRNAAYIISQLRQTGSARDRSKAIITFYKGLRRDDLFQPLWDAVGGAAGLAGLMAEFSVRDVRLMCRCLGKTASAQHARPERHAALGDLVRLLHDDGPGTGTERDPRPLEHYYQNIVPACDLEVVRQWEGQGRPEWTKFQLECLFRGHREWYDDRFLKVFLFPANATQRKRFSAEKKAFQGNLVFSETILSTLIADKEGASHIPGDFMSEFAMPLLRRLVRRRKYDDETRDKFLNLVVRCIQVHEEQLAVRLDANTGGLVRYAVQRWSVARDGKVPTTIATKHQTELCLGRLIQLMPRTYELQDIFTKLLLGRETHVEGYQLLRLILRHARQYEIDINDGTPSTLSRLGDITAQGNLWPARLFTYLDGEEAIGRVERLSDLDATSSVLERDRSSSGPRTVLEQARDPGSSIGDAEIVRCLLFAKCKKRAGDPTWLARARSLIHERRKMSEQGHDWQQRAFWSTSALNLCVATGDMEILDDTILWARRFNNQPLVVRDLYNTSVFATAEITDLLSAIPNKNSDGNAPSEQAVAVANAVETSGRILIHLVGTIKMSLSQSQPQHQHWNTVLRLPELVVDERLKRRNPDSFEELFKSAMLGPDHPSSSAVEAVWKPTLATLVEAESILSISRKLSITTTGTDVFRRLPGRSGEIRADLASFLIQKMRAHLGAEGLRLKIPNIVEMVTSVASSDQPWLAIPFIRDMILDGEGADSLWHRELLSVRFLSSLPYKAASDLLHKMAGAMIEKMREQNSRPAEEIDDGGKPVARPPAIKVTTIKMMAQLLQESLIIGPSAASDILLGLLAEARHIDVLVAIVNSLLSILKVPTYSPEIHTRVLDALEEKLSPILPRLSERQPLSEADWAAVESGQGKLPDVAEERPLIWLLRNQDYTSGSMSVETKTRLIELLVRVPTQSALHNARWNKLFLSRNSFSLDDGEHLPASPACLDLASRLLSKFPAYIPASMLTVLRDMALVNLDPTPGIVRVTEAVKADRDLVNSNAGNHWLAQFDNPGFDALRKFGVAEAASLLQQAPEYLAPKRDDGDCITVQLLGQTVLTIADRTLSCELSETFERLITQLGSNRFRSRVNWLAWRENCIPILKTLTAKIDGLRSVRKQLPGEKPLPRVLPSSFKLRLSVLPIPYSRSSKEPAREEEMDTLVSELAELLEWLVQRRVPYHHEFAQLKKEVRQDMSRRDCARAALRLGNLNGNSLMAVDATEEREEQGPKLADYLRLDMAGDLLAEAGDLTVSGEGILPEIKQMVRDWMASDVELVRLTGLSVEKRHRELFA